MNMFGLSAISYDLLVRYPDIAKDYLSVEVASHCLIEVTAWAGLTVLHYTRNLHIKVLRLSE
jgi:hypothetical protein